MIKVTCIILLLIILTYSKSEAQENKHSLWATYYNSPSELSYKLLYRVDSFNEPYKEATIRGFGGGFSVRMFKIYSPEFNFIIYNMNGKDGHLSGDNEEHVSFEGFQFRIGGSFHLMRENPGLNFEHGFIYGTTRTNSPLEIVDERDQEGSNKGIYLGPALIFKINDSNAIKVGARIVYFSIRNKNVGSFAVTSLDAINTELSVSYMFSF